MQREHVLVWVRIDFRMKGLVKEVDVVFITPHSDGRLPSGMLLAALGHWSGHRDAWGGRRPYILDALQW